MKEVFTVLSLSLAGQQPQQQQPASQHHGITVPPPVASSVVPSAPSSQTALPYPSTSSSAKSSPSKSSFSWFKNICKTQLPFLFSDFSIMRAVTRELRCCHCALASSFLRE
jgi:hypothetical protein